MNNKKTVLIVIIVLLLISSLYRLPQIRDDAYIEMFEKNSIFTCDVNYSVRKENGWSYDKSSNSFINSDKNVSYSIRDCIFESEK